jgi:hypothetical protein
VSRRSPGRDGDVGAVCGLIHDEHVGAAHRRALTKTNPCVVGRGLDLNEDVAAARVCGALRDVELIANIAITLLGELSDCS